MAIKNGPSRIERMAIHLSMSDLRRPRTLPGNAVRLGFADATQSSVPGGRSLASRRRVRHAFSNFCLENRNAGCPSCDR